MAKTEYPINKEFYPLDRFAFSLNPRVVALSRRFMGVPEFVWDDPDVSVARHEVPAYQGGSIELLSMPRAS